MPKRTTSEQKRIKQAPQARDANRGTEGGR